MKSNSNELPISVPLSFYNFLTNFNKDITIRYIKIMEVINGQAYFRSAHDKTFYSL